MKKKKNLNNIHVESKRIRWSSLGKTMRAFFVTIIFLAIFAFLIVVFSWLVTAFLDWID